MNQSIIFSPVGHCIYCGKIEEDLTDEHIIPYGLGGNLVLPKSSCKKCSKITSNTERFCLKPMYGNLRHRLNLPTRRKKNRSPIISLEIRGSNGENNNIHLPAPEFPLLALGFRFPAPGLLRGEPQGDSTEGEVICRYINEQFQKYIPSDGRRVKIGSICIDTFCRMLAKIAHSYAIAKLGETAFNPLLPKIILEKNIPPTYLVGGDKSSEPKKQPKVLHDIYPQLCLSHGIEYVLIAIQLFAFIDMPRYHVVVGEKIG